MREVLSEGCLRPARAASLAGSLRFSTAQTFSKCGGLAFRALQRWALGARSALTDEMRLAL
eukprot:2427638-Lingulodinium_polyedra.AAC.1